MTRLIVDGRERADTWDHLAGDEAPGGGSFTAGVGLVRAAFAADKAAATGDGGVTESIAAIVPKVPTRGGSTPPGRGFTVDLARWLAQRDELIAHAERTGRRLGVRLATGDDPMHLAGDIGRFALIIVEIPSSADGRFFSIAARLREHLHYPRELRVTGDVAPDQLSFMQRCGINAFEIGDQVDVERFLRRYRRFYQSSGPLTTRDNLITLARRRKAAAPRPRGASGAGRRTARQSSNNTAASAGQQIVSRSPIS